MSQAVNSQHINGLFFFPNWNTKLCQKMGYTPEHCQFTRENEVSKPSKFEVPLNVHSTPWNWDCNRISLIKLGCACASTCNLTTEGSNNTSILASCKSYSYTHACTNVYVYIYDTNKKMHIDVIKYDSNMYVLSILCIYIISCMCALI